MSTFIHMSETRKEDISHLDDARASDDKTQEIVDLEADHYDSKAEKRLVRKVSAEAFAG